MDGRRVLFQLLQQKSVNHLFNFFALLTNEIDQLYVLKQKEKKANVVRVNDSDSEEESAESKNFAAMQAYAGGAEDIGVILADLLDPVIKNMALAKLEACLVRVHIMYVYLFTRCKELQDQLTANRGRDRKIQSQIDALKPRMGVADAMRNILVGKLVEKKYGLSNPRNCDAILKPIEKEYDDFACLLERSTPANKKKVCALPIKEVADTSHCIAMTELIPLSKLNEAVTKFYPNKVERNRFKQKLCHHMIQHVENITEAQKQFAEEGENKDSYNTHPLFNVLKTIENLILTTKWTLGWFGGVDIIDTKTKQLLNTVPHGMSDILMVIRDAFKHTRQQIASGATFLFDTLSKMAKAAIKSAENPGISFLDFGKRHDSTQQGYNQINKIISDNFTHLKSFSSRG